MSKQIAIIRFGFTTKTIGEHGSPLHLFAQTVAMLRSGIICFCYQKLSARTGNGGSPCGRIISAPTGFICSIFKNHLTAEDCLFDLTCEGSALERGVFAFAVKFIGINCPLFIGIYKNNIGICTD